MRIIGITGGVGSGKSTVLGLLAEKYGAEVLEADKAAHKLMEPESPVYNEIVSAFTGDILLADGTIDRAALGRLVFADKKKLEQLNKITHPAVRAYILNEIARAGEEGVTELFVIEAALLLEEGYDEICDEIWYVYAEPEVRIRRLMSSRGYDREKCLSIMASQSDDDFYRARTAHTIDNSGSQKNTEIELDKLLNK